MSKVIDLTGKTFNHWTVLERAENNHRGEAMWKCQCDCENKTIRIVNGYSLRNGTSKSCGCLQKKIVSKNNLKNILGQKFGHLTVVDYYGSDNNKKSLWKCQCDCDAKTIIIVRGTDLRAGKTISCGCISSKGEEKIAQLLVENNIPFEKEKTFPTCKFPESNGLARFDFYVNNQYLIEFDGIQHFKPTFNALNPEYFDNIKKNDKYKNQWCQANNIPLIRIPYFKLNTLTIEDLIL